MFLIKRRLGYKTSKNEKYFKNYFVKESTSKSLSTICNFCGRGGHNSGTCPLRNGFQKVSTSKLKKTWVEKSKVTLITKDPRRFGYPKLLNFLLYGSKEEKMRAHPSSLTWMRKVSPLIKLNIEI